MGDALHVRVALARDVPRLYEAQVGGCGPITLECLAQVMVAVFARLAKAGRDPGDVDEVLVDFGPLINAFCCQAMYEHLCQTCDDHLDLMDCPDLMVIETADGEWGLIVHDGGRSTIKINHCPWCGQKLQQARPVPALSLVPGPVPLPDSEDRIGESD